MNIINEQLTDIFFHEQDMIQEFNMLGSGIINKIKGRLISTIKSKDPKKLDTLLKPIPERSFEEIKSLAKKKLEGSEFEKNYRLAKSKVRVKNEAAKEALSISAAISATAQKKTVDEIYMENPRVFDPKNVIMLLLGIVFLFKFVLLANEIAGYTGDSIGSAISTIASVSPMYTLFAVAATFMIIKTTYNLIAGKEAKSLFILL